MVDRSEKNPSGGGNSKSDTTAVTVSPRLLQRILGSTGTAPNTWTDRQATIYKDEFAIIEIDGAGSAIVDLKAPSLVCAAFDLTCEQALAKLAQPGGVEELRAYISAHPRLLPLEYRNGT